MKYFFFGFILFYLLPLNSQVVTVSEAIQLSNDFSYDILGMYDGRTLLFRNKLYKQEIQVFDEQMHMIREKEFTLEERKSNVIGVVGDKDFFSVIYSYRQKRDIYIMMKQFDGDLIQIDSAYVIDILQDQILTPSFEFEHSESREYGLIYSTDKSDELDAFVFNIPKRELIWSERFIFTNSSLRKDFRNILISNDGDMILALEKNNTNYRLEDHVLEYYYFNNQVGTMKKFVVPMAGVVSFDVSFKYDNVNDRLMTVGLFSDKNFGRANGLYMASHQFEQNTKVQEPTYLPFSPDIISDLYRKNVGANRGIGDLEIQSLILRQDGGVMVVSEIKKEYSVGSYYTGRRNLRNDGYNYHADFHYDDMVVFSVHPDGSTHWNTVLYKRQYSHDDGAIYSSFFVFKTPSRIRLVYNDEIGRENNVSEYVINGNGELLRKSLMSTAYQDLQLRFKDAVQVSSSEFIVPSQRQLTLKLVKVGYQ